MNVQVQPKEQAFEEPASMIEQVAQLAQKDLAPLVHDIDLKGHYPEDFMRALGTAGAYSAHAPMNGSGNFDIESSVRAMSAVSEHCLSTGFCVWCQDALGW